jgi:hypothetical protein
MRARTNTVLILVFLPLLLFGTALGGEGVEVKITNDGTTDILVTVYDMNTVPKRLVLTNTRINGFTSVPVSLVGDASARRFQLQRLASYCRAAPDCGSDPVAGLGSAVGDGAAAALGSSASSATVAITPSAF